MPWDSVDKWRDEDYWPHDEGSHGDAGNPGTRQVPAPPVKGDGSSAVSALPASGRTGAAPLAPFKFQSRVEVGDRQQSKDVRLAAPVGRVPGGDNRRVATPLACAPFLTLALFVLAFTLYALGVHA